MRSCKRDSRSWTRQAFTCRSSLRHRSHRSLKIGSMDLQLIPNRDLPIAPPAKDVSAETSSVLEQTIDTERRKLMQVHSLLHCLYEVLLYAASLCEIRSVIAPAVSARARPSETAAL